MRWTHVDPDALAEPLAARRVNIPSSVQPGQEVDIAVDMCAIHLLSGLHGGGDVNELGRLEAVSPAEGELRAGGAGKVALIAQAPNLGEL
eukprot:CAMPEP_0179891186 /NCGR_PEP_ID=MMETSP0982-20121206/33540_1 /TAXON_ID=483367 /ORGANISM="non described non described, Strain CCMP 2436" /LENGTH=89 /DNA_ID=CAMNT_0021787537 /DNA_START=394 /DNA_END=663 /DNA_ORIENTATION=-